MSTPKSNINEHSMEMERPGNTSLSAKFMGTTNDQEDMAILGRVQVLRRNFRFISIMGFACVLLATWELLLTSMVFYLLDGGPAGLFWGFLITTIGFFFVYMSIAEMASMYYSPLTTSLSVVPLISSRAPTAAGQYHWVSEFAPPRIQKFLSYITGWLCAMGWQGSIISFSFLIGTIIQGLIALNVSTYVFQRWHGTLLAIAVTASSILFNTSFAKYLPAIEIFILIIHIAGAFAVLIPIWILAPRVSSYTAFLEIQNNGDWRQLGTTVMIGLLACLGSMLGYDCAVHMAEEVNDASRTLPIAILWGYSVNAVVGLILVITICYTTTNIPDLIASPTGYPFIQYFFSITKSYTGANIMVAIMITAMTAALICEIATASRQIWSFARDRGLPFSSTLSKVRPGWDIPLNAVIVSLVLSMLFQLINIGSTAALNAITSFTVASLLTSYTLTIGSVLWRRLFGKPLPPSKFSLGRFGVIINGVSLCFLTVFFVFSFFPLVNHPTPVNMNWSVVMYSGVLGIAGLFYVFKGRHVYVPPVVILKRAP